MTDKKKYLISVNANGFVILLLFSFSLICCTQRERTEHDLTIGTEQQTITINQSPDDLLIGVSRAVCYSGFRTGQHPDRGDGAINPTDEQILEDLKIISKNSLFRLIRLYDSGENSESVLKIIDKNKLDIKVMLGIWLKAELSNHESCAWLTEPIPQKILDQNKIANQEEIARGIRLVSEYPEIVVAVNVGNEALVDWNDHKVDTDTIISYVRKVRKAIQQPVTVAENYEWWAANGAALARELNFIAVHIYPVWEGKDIDDGLSYSIENIQKVRDSLPESKIVISEAGWASVASEFGDRASEEKQQLYYNQMMSWAADNNITTFFFEAFDEDWKGDPDNMMGAEKHWGLFTVDRNPKKVMAEYFEEENIAESE
jgi:exo-beta-1,3-glucanase (GH17 family)